MYTTFSFSKSETPARHLLAGICWDMNLLEDLWEAGPGHSMTRPEGASPSMQSRS